MRIGCLQFAPQVGDVDNNITKADAVLDKADPEDLDLLVLPELALSGYNFRSLTHISPSLEESNSGISSLWARTTALKHDCTVLVGYPEKVDPTLNWPTSPEYYNSAIVINGEGETVANYRKTHLYYTDETWALEGSHGFFAGRLPGLGRTAIGICMDLNPYKFEAPWNKFEFAQHALKCGARLVIVSMAWLTNDDPRTFNSTPQEPDTNTLLYWVSRLEPIISINSNQEVIVVFANRCGQEDEATYAGTSAVIGIRSGEVWVYGILGRGETDLLVVDTDSPPYAKLIYRTDEQDVEVEDKHSPDVKVDEGDKPSPGSNHEPQNQEEHSFDLSDPTRQLNDHSNVPVSVAEGEENYYDNQEHHQFAGPHNRRVGDELDSHYVNTPSAPSPTPDAFQPQLEIPPHQVMLRRYLESESPILRSTPLQSSIAALTLSDSVAPSRASKPSVNTSRRDWSPPTQHTTAMETLHFSTYDSEYMAPGDEKRHSLRSDVSVWNNQPGRASEIAVPMTAPPELFYRNAPEMTNYVEGGIGIKSRRSEKSESKTRSRQRSPISSSWNNYRDADYKLPTSRQASKSRHRKKNSYDPYGNIERSFSSNAAIQADTLQSSTALKLGTDEVGRGRRRSSQRQSKEGRQRSHSGQVAHPEPIDLSQFALIEEYPSPNCPVHGSRPPSGTRHRNPSGARGRSGNRSRPLPETDTGRRQSSRRNTPKTEGRKDRSNSMAAANSSKPAPPSNSKPTQSYDKGNGSAAGAAATTNFNHEPKTPTAMLLVHDPDPAMGSSDRTLSPLKCVEKNQGHVIARPLSSVW